jgi:hypothetical protein
VPFSTYAELQLSIRQYLEQEDISAQITDFIRLAEVRMQRELSVHGMHKQATGDFDTNTVALPVDYIEAVSWRLISSDPIITLQYIAPNRFYSMRTASYDGTPRFFTTVGTNALVAPSPTGSPPGTYNYELEYLAELPPLTDNNTSNWLLAKGPDLYLYASLLEAMPFVIDDERLGVWVKMYERALSSLISVDLRGRYRPAGVMRPQSVPWDGRRWARF